MVAESTTLQEVLVYEHAMVNRLEAHVDDNVHTNGIENFWSLLKRTISGTYVSVEPLPPVPLCR